jgi:hypothetical protein
LAGPPETVRLGKIVFRAIRFSLVFVGETAVIIGLRVARLPLDRGGIVADGSVICF